MSANLVAAATYDNPVRRYVLLAGLACLACAHAGDAGGAGDRHAAGPCADAPASLELARAGEEGPPLVVRGKVLRPDGRTPAGGVIVYAYHTGTDGLYHRPGERELRYHGWMRTRLDGTFELRTIRPGPYPQGGIAAHVHTQLWGPDVPPQYGPDLLFQGDPYLSSLERQRSEAAGRFGSIKKPDAQGTVELEIRLSAEGDVFEDNTRHGLDPCRAR